MNQPDYFDFDDYKVRKAKLEEIRALGVNPYPHHFTPTDKLETLTASCLEKEVGTYEEAIEKKSPHVIVAGRLILHRAMGKNIFAQIQEELGHIQLMFNRDITKVVGLKEDSEVTDHKFIEKKLDLGDIIGVEGHLFRTQKGELTVMVHQMTLLTKALLPLPDKHSGLKDKETRYRKRHLDLISSNEVMITFIQRSKIISLMRTFFDREGFMEFETPVLESLYGGAQAKPFTTHLNALHQDMFLRISLELPLKKLIVGGFNRVYQIGKDFRNEGIDHTHNPEFTMVEFYAAYWDYNDQRKFTERLFEFIAMQLFGTTKLGLRKDKHGKEHEIDLKAPWPAITMYESIHKFGGYKVDDMSDDEIRTTLKTKTSLPHEKIDEISERGILIQKMFEEFVECHLIQPHFITDHPIETTPLCKLHRQAELAKKGIVERFELFILGTEFCNAYTELNDPELQRSLLERQQRMLEAGDEEANPIDEEFLEAIYQGMPPTGGNGIGIDRLVMLFTNQTSIRDVIFFPLMKNAQEPSLEEIR